MVVKPGAAGSALALVVALVLGPTAAVPFWRSRPAPAPSAQPAAAVRIPEARVEA
jgi:hypothetical protein